LRKASAGSCEIIDLRSHNGTFVDGKRVSHATLTDQDIIRISHSTLRLAEGELWQFADDSQLRAGGYLHESGRSTITTRPRATDTSAKVLTLRPAYCARITYRPGARPSSLNA
jgi:pSer/pThr/pTyr-binding forkhead associated (FHA) protein